MKQRFYLGIASLGLVATIAFAAATGDRLKSPVLVGQGSAGTLSVGFDTGNGANNAILSSTANTAMSMKLNGTDRFTQSTTASTYTTPLRAADGTVGAPAYSFTSDTDTGMYSGGANNLQFSVGNSTVMGLSATSVDLTTITSNDGTAALPAYRFAADTNTGMFRAAGDVLGFSVGGIETVNISSGGLQIFGGGAFKVKVFSGSLTATSTTTLSVTGTVIGAFGWTARAANVNFAAMQYFNSGSVPDGCYFDGNTAASITSSQIKINNGEASTRAYTVVAFYQ